jgi:4-hydroxybenzoate polyprenyltransferase
MSIRAWLQLVRLPNLFTAAADPLAGFLIAGGRLDRPDVYGLLMLAGALIYAGGMALNDVFDAELDAVERPERPIPSGRITRRAATVAGGGLLACGPLLAGLASGASALVAVGLVVCVLGYDALARRLWVGPLVMGLCRGANLAMGGVTPGNAWSGSLLPGVALAYLVFVAGVTVTSRTENHDGRAPGLWLGLGLLAGAVAAFGTAVAATIGHQGPDASWLGAAVLGGVALTMARAGNRVLKAPTAGHKRAMVKTGVLSMPWLLAAVTLSAVGLAEGLAVASLAVPARLLARVFPPT